MTTTTTSHDVINHVDIIPDKINTEEIIQLVTSPDCGAATVFLGTTRNYFEGKSVLQLEYEAYDGMAKKQMLKCCEEIRTKWNVKHIAIVHRTGIVPVCESSIIIAISSPHRHASIEAVSYAIDEVKAKLPVWKKEIYADDTSNWKENSECAWKSSVDTPPGTAK